jgi:hypothetical protein
MTDRSLTKVLVDLPHHWATSGESMWARALGDDLFELHNSPFYAYDLNYLDIVRAITDGRESKPLVKEVVRRSGHRTLRVLFLTDTVESQRLLLLKGLNRFGVTWEGSDRKLFSLDVPPNGDYQATCNQLGEWEQAGHLEYETCEARSAGTFDDLPGN